MQLDVVYNSLIENADYSNIAFIKVDANNTANTALLSHYQVRFVPALYTYTKKAERKWSYVGAVDEAFLRSKLDEIK